jgi:selenocysteine lyase/cysteine desulfurase
MAAELPTSSKELWPWVRVQQVLDPSVAYFDHATIGPSLRLALVAEYRARESQSMNLDQQARGADAATAREACTRFARFLGCDPEELAFTHGAGESLSIIASGLKLASGDEVVTTTQEHPAGLNPWLAQAGRRGVAIKQVALPAGLSGPEDYLGRIAGAVTDRTRVIAFCHVQHTDGALLPVADLCRFARQRGIVSVVDGAQALGMLDFDLRELECDFYASNFHKWFGGTHGTGLLYGRREMLKELAPLEVRQPTPADAPAMQRFGTLLPYSWPAIRGSEAALDFHQSVGRDRLQGRVRELAIYARLRLQQLPDIEFLTPNRPGLWGGILTMRFAAKSAVALVGSLAAERIIARAVSWPGLDGDALRISTHAANTHDEIERLFQALKRYARG